MIKEIAVHLTGSHEDGNRLAFATGLGTLFDAHVTGLLVNELPDTILAADATMAPVLAELIEEGKARARQAAARLEADFERTGVAHELRQLDVYPYEIGTKLAEEVRLCDLVVATRPYGDRAKQHHIEETVLFSSGRPCVFVPPGHAVAPTLETVLVAWKNTREAALALAGAMPILQKARAVTVAIVEEHAAEEDREAPEADIATYLGRHGVRCDVRLLDGWTDAGAAILADAVTVDADLIVMGAYGHSRLRERVFGGATRHVLAHAPIPVLASH
jgi:nucleotide-binding universal stress UspA family protein